MASVQHCCEAAAHGMIRPGNSLAELAGWLSNHLMHTTHNHKVDIAYATHAQELLSLSTWPFPHGHEFTSAVVSGVD